MEDRSEPTSTATVAVTGAVALEDLYGRRLARAVSAEKAQDLTGRDFKGDAVDPFNLAVGLAQILRFDDASHPSDCRQQR
jgi:hypothetical protein